MRLENGKDGGGNNPGALNSFYGHTHSETFKRAASERMSNRIVSDKTRKKMSEYQKNKIRVYGKKWWNNGINETISFEKPDETYILGRLPKNRK